MQTPTVTTDSLKTLYAANSKRINAILVVVGLLLMGEVLFTGFLSVNSVMQILRIAAIIGIFALSQMVIMAVGQGVDVSTGFIATIAAVIGVTIIDGQNSNIILGFMVGIGIGAFCGLFNGVGVAIFKIPSLLMTLATGTIIAGAMNIYTRGRIVSGRAAPLMEQWFARMAWGVIPTILFVWVIIGVIATFMVYRTRWGRILLGTGANRVAAELSGTNVVLVEIIAFVISGAVAGFSGLVLIGYIGRVMRDLGLRYMLPSIAACVVGGVSIWGGEGNYPNVMIGAIVMETVRIILYVLGWGDAARYSAYGLVLVAMLMLYARNKRN